MPLFGIIANVSNESGVWGIIVDAVSNIADSCGTPIVDHDVGEAMKSDDGRRPFLAPDLASSFLTESDTFRGTISELVSGME